MKYRWRAKWTEVWVVGHSNDPARPVGMRSAEEHDVLIRREYGSPYAAHRALPHIARRFPADVTFTLETLEAAVAELARQAAPQGAKRGSESRRSHPVVSFEFSATK